MSFLSRGQRNFTFGINREEYTLDCEKRIRPYLLSLVYTISGFFATQITAHNPTGLVLSVALCAV